jgi:hypothetical protein
MASEALTVTDAVSMEAATEQTTTAYILGWTVMVDAAE